MCIHAERFVSFLKTARGEVLECINILPKDEPCSLSNSQREGRNKFFSLDIRKSSLTSHRIHQQVAIERETCISRLLSLKAKFQHGNSDSCLKRLPTILKRSCFNYYLKASSQNHWHTIHPVRQGRLALNTPYVLFKYVQHPIKELTCDPTSSAYQTRRIDKIL